MLNRRITRTLLAGVEKTDFTASINADALALALVPASLFYIGYHAPFASRFFKMKTVNTAASVLSIKYWNGSAFVAVTDLIDQTKVAGKTLAQSGFISWTNPGDWQKSAVTGLAEELFWVKVEVSADLFASTELEAILNLFSDDGGLRALYPQLVNDVRWLPTGRTDFFEQHQAAKDHVVLSLKQRKLITDESQIIDINSVWNAAVHACAVAIIHPRATSDESKELLERAIAERDDALAETYLDVDQNKDGKVDQAERSSISTTTVLRR